jgi:glutaconate CoA-transferase, subunit A
MNKVVDLPTAMSVVGDGCHLGLAGFAITRNAIAAVRELIEQQVRDITLSQVIGGMETDLLVGAGCVSHLNYSGGSLDRFGPLHSVNRAINDGVISASEYSSLALTLRFQAGALGAPFVGALPMLGSQLLDRLDGNGGVLRGKDPFTGRPVVYLAPLVPEVTVVHVDVADTAGNAAIDGPRWSLRETVLAADKVVITCEQICEEGAIPPDQVVIPGEIVTAIAVIPKGALPTAVYGSYDYDRRQLEEYAAVSRAGGAEFSSYLGQPASRLALVQGVS